MQKLHLPDWGSQAKAPPVTISGVILGRYFTLQQSLYLRHVAKPSEI